METKILDYRIIIEPETRDDGSAVYCASCPTLGVYDYGNSVEEALKSIKDGIQLAVELLAKEKKLVPMDNLDSQIITSMKIAVPYKPNFSFA
ncbi:MAG: type II toxin-antitoxin system HicB family antitoxin [Patescibacteria group bacterium]